MTAPTPYPAAPSYYGPHVAPGGGLRRASLVVSAAVATVGIAAGATGVFVGTRIARTEQPSVDSSTGTVRAQTVDLCTRYAAGYRALPSPQKTGADLIPAANYISDALRDNPMADNDIRTAVADSLSLTRDQAAHLSGEAVRGAIQPPSDWSVDRANHADQRVWDACRAYS